MEKFIIITEDMIENLNQINMDELFKQLPRKVLNYLETSKTFAEIDFINAICDCKSPIEQILSLQMNSMNLINFNVFNPNIDVIEIEKQLKIIANGEKYVVDFNIPVFYGDLKNGKNFVIECDGHDWHEKTKEQVKRDKKRERDLISEGYIVIRFSGSEIYENPYKCVKEIINIILKNS